MSPRTPRLRPSASSILVGGLVASLGSSVQAAAPERQPNAFLQDVSAQDGDLVGTSLLFDKETLFAGAPSVINNANQGLGKVFTWHPGPNNSWVAGAPLLPTRASAQDFGASLAIYRSTLLVGAPGSNSRRGSVEVFRRVSGDTWIHRQTLVSSDASPGDIFGSAVAINGNTLVVGAKGSDTRGSEAGAVYIFERGYGSDTWTQKAKLLAPQGEAQDRFGSSVAIEGDRIVVGAPGHKGAKPSGAPSAAPDGGRVFSYRKSSQGWRLEGEAVIAAPGPADALGVTVALDRGRLLAGAPGVTVIDTSGREPRITPNAGAVFEYKWQGNRWVQDFVFELEDRRENELFGSSLQVNQGRLLVGGQYSENNEAGVSQVSMWSRPENQNSWTKNYRFTAPRRGSLQNWGFGQSVALEGSRVAVGAPFSVAPGSFEDESGGVSLYTVPAPPQSAPLLPLWVQIAGLVSLIGAMKLTRS